MSPSNEENSSPFIKSSGEHELGLFLAHESNPWATAQYDMNLGHI